ncbi:unnamed protein product, partial [Mesorhabditis spiculigera]
MPPGSDARNLAWIDASIPIEITSITLNKNSTLLEEKHGRVSHYVRGHPFDWENQIFYGLKVSLEFQMEPGKVYRDFEFEEVFEEGHFHVEIVGTWKNKLNFVIPEGIVVFTYTKTAPEFTVTFKPVLLPNGSGCDCPVFGMISGDQDNGWLDRGRKFSGQYPQACGLDAHAGFVCGWVFSTARMPPGSDARSIPWIDTNIPNEISSITLRKNATLLEEKNGRVSHYVRGHAFDWEKQIFYGLKVELEFPMESGRVYRDFEFEDVFEEGTFHVEIVGNRKNKLNFVIPKGIVVFTYNKTAPEFNATFTPVLLPNGSSCDCPVFGMMSGGEGDDGLVRGRNFKGEYPQACGLAAHAGFVCGWVFGGWRGPSTVVSSGHLATGDLLYVRDLTTRKATCLNMTATPETLGIPQNHDFAIYFFGSNKPDSTRKLDLVFNYNNKA